MGIYKDLLAYKKAYQLAMKIFIITKNFPAEERFSLTSQFRKSSRSVCANLAECYRRRRYKDYYASKLNDCETENTETEVWIDFSRDCGYLTVAEHNELEKLNTEV